VLAHIKYFSIFNVWIAHVLVSSVFTDRTIYLMTVNGQGQTREGFIWSTDKEEPSLKTVFRVCWIARWLDPENRYREREITDHGLWQLLLMFCTQTHTFAPGPWNCISTAILNQIQKNPYANWSDDMGSDLNRDEEHRNIVDQPPEPELEKEE
jgi:hypothetical protein